MKFLKYLLIITMCCSVLTACDDMYSTHEEYIKGGEIYYPGKVEALTSISGNNRIKITFNMPSDPKITRVKIYWNNGADSLTQLVTPTPGVRAREILLNNMAEGTYLFDVYSLDDAGHKSVKTILTGTSYGDAYAATLLNRAIKTVKITAGSGVIEWYGANLSAVNKTVQTEVIYTDNTSVVRTVIVPPNVNASTVTITTLPNYKSGNAISFRTSYLPTADAIDSFYSKTDKRNIP